MPERRRSKPKAKRTPAPLDPRKDYAAGQRLFTYIIYAETYNNAQVAVFESLANLNKWLEQRGMERETSAPINGLALTVEDPQKMEWYLLYLPPDCPVETVAHECLHIAWDILGGHGVRVEHKNHETLAYLMQHLMRQVLRRRGKAKR